MPERQVARLDPVVKDFEQRTKLQKFACFYPQQRVVNKFMERNCDALANMLWMKAYPDIDHSSVASQLYESSLEKHLRSVPHLDEREVSFDPEYSYKRAETVQNLLKKNIQEAQSKKADQVANTL